MNKFFSLCFSLWSILVMLACAPTTTDIKSPPAYTEAKHLHEGIEILVDKLVASKQQLQAGKLAVADFIGPGDKITGLGEHISDKVSIALFSSGAFPDIMERKQLKQLLLSRKTELSGYFDPSTVPQLGKMIGVDSVVIGAIDDLGSFFDVTAKLIESETGKIQGMADVRLIKDDAVIALLSRVQTATLAISIDPPVSGTVAAGGKQGKLQNGLVTLTEIPYGDCPIVIQPHGYEQIRRTISIRAPAETLSIRLKMKLYEVSFQVVPPDASLVVNGKAISLNPQGFAKVSGLQAQQCSFVIKAQGFQDHLGTFYPDKKHLITLNLQAKDPFYATKNIFFQKAQTVEKERDFSVRLWTDKKIYRLGDAIYFYFRSEKDCYLNLVDIASNGEIRLIFPNRFHPDNFVQGGVIYRIPGENYNFLFEVEPPLGIERIYAVASTRPFKIFEHDFNKEAFFTLTRGEPRGKMLRSIGIKLDQAQLSSAAECIIHIR